jgi:uncharacterized hydrophobic protein (TIGR00271 family)
MAKNLFDNFSLNYEKEKYETVIENINNGVVFKGTNLWILIFAILVASLGLNVNSTAVIIGAMLISPLMGPIMGIGLGIGINDLSLLRKALNNYFFASGTGLITSFIYFFVTPLNEAHSEILARISPNIYDVLIAFFGGFAGIIATSSKQKGNVIPGVAIATALMPPLCTAGYGLATLKLNFLLGALYLFIINTVFIALATLITVRLLRFPGKHLATERAEKRAHRIIIAIAIITVLPSIYFAYDIIQQNKFMQQANRFIDLEANFTNDYLLKKTIDPKAQTINLVYGGKKITEAEISALKNKLKKYGLVKCVLDVKQGFAYLTENTNTDNEINQVDLALTEKDKEIAALQNRLSGFTSREQQAEKVYNELETLYPIILKGTIKPQEIKDSSHIITLWQVFIQTQIRVSKSEEIKMKNWLKERLEPDSVKLVLTR